MTKSLNYFYIKLLTCLFFNYLRIIILLFGFAYSSFIIHHSSFAPKAYAQTSPLPEQPVNNQEQFVRAKITDIKKQETLSIGGYKTLVQELSAVILDGKDKGKAISITQSSNYRISTSQKASVGEEVIVDAISPMQSGNTRYVITDTYRIPQVLYLLGAFFILTIFFTGKRGFGALLGLCISLAVILGFIVPQIIHQNDPLLMCFIGAVIILFSTTFIAHGFSKQTAIAAISTFLTLIATYLISLLAVGITHLNGLGTEDSYLLEITPNAIINPKGLLLGGIIITTLGALNDITTTQVASMFILYKQNNKLKFLDLAENAFKIGQEHILSMVNTLVLAYAGVSLPIFIFFILNPSHLPAWVILNNESVVEEIVRTVAASMGLFLAIPITTFIASWQITKAPSSLTAAAST